MKFACDSCHTKYSISDDRVRGRVLKIRCKKCDFVITVREDQGASAEATVMSNDDDLGKALDNSPAFAAGAVAATTTTALEADDWYLSFDGEQEGPSSLKHALERLRAHQGKDVEIHAWRPGFLVWLPCAEVPELAVMLAKAQPRTPVRAMTPSPIGGGRPAGPLSQGQVAREPAGARAALAVSTDLAAPAPAAARSAPPIPMAARADVGMRPGPAAPSAHGGLGGGLVSSSTNGSASRAAPAAAAAVAPAPARDLFADSGPQSLFPTTDEEAAKPSDRDDDGPDLAISNEASGLVNIAHLTAAAMGQKPAGPVFVNGHNPRVPLAAPSAPMDPMLDDAIEATTAPVPVVVVAGAAQSSGSIFKWAAGLFVLVSIGLGGGVWYLLTHRAPPETIIVTEPVRHGDDSPITVTDPVSGKVVVDNRKTPTNGGAAGAKKTAVTKGTGPVVTTTPTTGKTNDGMSGSQKALADLYKDDGDRATPHAIQGGGGSRAGGGQVSNGAILATVNSNKKTLSLCYERALKHDSSLKSGRVPIAVTIGISGRPTSVSIADPQFANTELGQCFVQSVRRWNFPPSDSSYETEFPFILQAQ